MKLNKWIHLNKSSHLQCDSPFASKSVRHRSFHHLAEDEKILFITQLLYIFEPGGKILIGDVYFKTREDLLACKAACGDNWDDDEIYFVLSELENNLNPICKLTFREFSFCAGIIEISRV